MSCLFFFVSTKNGLTKSEQRTQFELKNKDAVTTINELERIIEKRQPDLEQQKKQLEQVDMKVQEINNTIEGTFELKKSLLSMLNKL